MHGFLLELKGYVLFLPETGGNAKFSGIYLVRQIA